MKQITLKLSILAVLAAMILASCSGVTALMPASGVINKPNQPAQQAQPALPAQAATSNNTASASANVQAGPLSGYESVLEDIYTRVNPAVVNIRVVEDQSASSSQNQALPGFPGQNTPQFNQALGSGFVWDTQGHIVTNNHVVSGASKIEVKFADGTIVPATLVGADPDSDLAVIKVDVSADKLTPVQVADSTQVKVGQVAMAIGNPFGLENTMTVGIVSALGRTLPADNSNSNGPTYSIPDIIQTDAPINPGNSGGVLVNDMGQLIGVTAAIESPSQANAGIGFVIPSAIVQKVVPVLIKDGKYVHSYLGITGTDMVPELATAMNLKADQRGVLVVDVNPDGPAAKAGLTASTKQVTIDGQDAVVGGDVITAIDGQPMKAMDELIAYLADHTDVGQKVTLTILRNGSEKSLDITLEARPATTTAQATTPSQNQQGQSQSGAWLGISAQPITPEIASAMNLPQNQAGVLVQQVESNSPADKAGMKGGFKPITVNGQRILVGGDVIVALDNQAVSSLADLRTFLQDTQPGQQISVTILRDGQTQTLTVTLEARPSGLP